MDLTPEALAAILADHKKWLLGEGGKRANLCSADLCSADLSSADLRSANLSYAKNAELIVAQSEILPREGEVIGWKKCINGVLVTIRVAARR